MSRFQNKNYKLLVYSCALNKSKGVLILAKRSLHLSIDLLGGDDIGRFAYAAVTLNHSKLMLVSIYAPNEPDQLFLNNICEKLLQFSDLDVIIGGDFNASINPQLDRSSSSNPSIAMSTSSLNRFITELNLIDPWRIHNPHTKGYTFYSPRHKSFSRIDYILISAPLLQYISNIVILPILISDHSPIICNITPVTAHAKPRRWRFNDSLLYDTTFMDQLKSGLTEFLEINMVHCANPQVLWEVTKCYLRGNCIAFSSKAKRLKNKRFDHLEQEIRSLEHQQTQSFSEEAAQNLLLLKKEYNSLSMSKAEFIIHRTKQNYYFHSDRTSHLLALRLKESESKANIDMLRSSDGKIVTDPRAINNTFKAFYSTLYSSEVVLDRHACKQFLENLNLPKLPEEDKNLLEEPLTLEELHSAAKSLKKGKSPGPDGIPPELYLAVWDIVGPLILNSMNFAIKHGMLHRDQNIALIILLQKKNKDPLNCSSYRPISLINSDVKILAKALVSRIEPLMDILIHFDQTGFLRGRLAADNMRRLLHIIEHSHTYTDTCAVFSLDALKAFDRLEWDFLWTVLDHFGFGPKFIYAIQTLYSNPTASISTGTYQSLSFPLQRGCRQGCPLSPLLFALSLEPLAQALRQSQVIAPITLLGSQHYISLYADDIILYLSDLENSIPNVLKLFHHFSSMSGYMINWDKSSLMALNNTSQHISLPNNIVFTKSFTYLGIKIMNSLSRIIQVNFGELSQKIKLDLQRWTNLQISMQARISTIKMNILPRLNFLFFMIPFTPPPKYFKELNSAVSRFVWNGRQPRIRFSVLQRTKLEGGLALPNFQIYYWAFQIRAIRTWTDKDSKVPWRSIESAIVHPHRLQDLPFTGLGRRNSHHKFGNVISSTLAAWYSAEKAIGHSKKLSQQSPLWNNAHFLSDQQPFVYPLWQSKGVSTFSNIFDGTGLRTFQDIQAEYSLPGFSFFLYLRLRSAMKAYGVPWNSVLSDHPMFSWIDPAKDPRGVVSVIYNSLLRSVYKPLKILATWDLELSWLGFHPDWETVWSNLGLTSKNLSHVLIHFKTIHRFYYTPYKRYRMKLLPNPYCSFCNTDASGTFLHMFWDCPMIQPFWKYVIVMLHDLTGLYLDLDPCLLLLNDDSKYQFSLGDKRVLMAGFTAAKKAILQQWITPDTNLKQFWIVSFHYIVCLECTTAKINKAKTTTVNTWMNIASALKELL